MIRKLLTKVIPQLHQPLLVTGLVLEEGQALWVEVDSERQKVHAARSGRFGDVDVAKQLQGRAVRTVIQGRDAFYGLLEEESPDPARLESHIPFPKDTYQVRSCTVPSMRHPGSNATFFAAALTSRIDHLKTELTSRGLAVQSVEVPVTALVREFVANRGPIEEPVVLLHIAREISHLVVIGGGHPYLARDFPMALQHFVYHQQMGQQSTEEEARDLLSRPEAAYSPPLIPVLASFASEVLRSVHSLPRSVSAIYLSGRGVLPDLEGRISQETGLPVFVDGSSSVRWREPNACEHHYKMALGLAL